MRTFMGKSNPDDEVCRHTPRSAEPVCIVKEAMSALALPVIMNSNLGYEHSFPLCISSQTTSSPIESSSPRRAATRLSYLTAASRRISKSSSAVLHKNIVFYPFMSI
ncbi:recombination protein RecR [Striga asiatica]|uniref:Recombination protein RecR n=1 Tax=Striga asiatica TaxID=4170 RepID=A0A5A7RBE2_STRAF|nr:recombination protein RecR [Striga asiatica]